MRTLLLLLLALMWAARRKWGSGPMRRTGSSAIARARLRAHTQTHTTPHTTSPPSSHPQPHMRVGARVHARARTHTHTHRPHPRWATGRTRRTSSNVRGCCWQTSTCRCVFVCVSRCLCPGGHWEGERGAAAVLQRGEIGGSRASRTFQKVCACACVRARSVASDGAMRGAAIEFAPCPPSYRTCALKFEILQGGKFDLSQDLCHKCLKYNKSCAKVGVGARAYATMHVPCMHVFGLGTTSRGVCVYTTYGRLVCCARAHVCVCVCVCVCGSEGHMS